jgi:hypothetical protein
MRVPLGRKMYFPSENGKTHVNPAPLVSNYEAPPGAAAAALAVMLTVQLQTLEEFPIFLSEEISLRTKATLTLVAVTCRHQLPVQNWEMTNACGNSGADF